MWYLYEPLILEVYIGYQKNKKYSVSLLEAETFVSFQILIKELKLLEQTRVTVTIFKSTSTYSYFKKPNFSTLPKCKLPN